MTDSCVCFSTIRVLAVPEAVPCVIDSVDSSRERDDDDDYDDDDDSSSSSSSS